MLTPQDLKKISFRKAVFGGYDMEDVDKVIDPLITDYQTLFEENAELKKQLLLQKERSEHEDQEGVTCKKCESKWTSKFTMDCCPFCGAPLRDDPILDPSSPVSVLSFIHNKYGAQVLCDKRLLSYFRDYAPGLQEQAALIGIAVDAGTYAEILALEGVLDDERLYQIVLCKERLKQRKFLAEEYAEKTIAWLLEALGWTGQKESPQNSGNRFSAEEGSIAKPNMGNGSMLPQNYSIMSEAKPTELPKDTQPAELPHAPFRYRDCKMLEDKYGNGYMSFTIPSYFDEITENALKGINAQTLYIPATIRSIHERALVNAGPRLKEVLINSRNSSFTISRWVITEKSTGKSIMIPDGISVRTYIEK